MPLIDDPLMHRIDQKLVNSPINAPSMAIDGAIDAIDAINGNSFRRFVLLFSCLRTRLCQSLFSLLSYFSLAYCCLSVGTNLKAFNRVSTFNVSKTPLNKNSGPPGVSPGYELATEGMPCLRHACAHLQCSLRY